MDTNNRFCNTIHVDDDSIIMNSFIILLDIFCMLTCCCSSNNSTSRSTNHVSYNGTAYNIPCI